jgi:hypothetical protein
LKSTRLRYYLAELIYWGLCRPQVGLFLVTYFRVFRKYESRLHERPFQLGRGSPPPQSVAVQGERSRSGPLRKTCSLSRVSVFLGAVSAIFKRVATGFVGYLPCQVIHVQQTLSDKEWCAGPTCHAEWLATTSLTGVLTQRRSSSLSHPPPTFHHQRRQHRHIAIIIAGLDEHTGKPLLCAKHTNKRGPTAPLPISTIADAGEAGSRTRLQLRRTTRVDC